MNALQELPKYISILFTATVLLTLWFLYKASLKSKVVLIVCIPWLIIQGIVAFTGFYTNTTAFPPHFVFLVVPAVLFIVFLFLFKRNFLNSLDVKWLHYLHTVRIPVEITLFLLFSYKLVPVVMTFEGRNFDIVSGITAPVIAYWGYSKPKLGKVVLILWNLICLALLFNIVFTAIFALPTAFQKIGFEQPNVGVLYFPFVWLPSFVVPVVLFSHLLSLRSLILTNKT